MAYDDEVLADGPVAYWPAGVTDVTGNGNTLTANGGVAAGGAVSILPNGDGVATNYDGSDDTLSGTLARPTSSMTIECWAKRTNTTSHDAIMGFRSGAGADFYMIPLSGGTNVEFQIQKSGGNATFNTIPMSAGVAHHLALVWDNSALVYTVYIDGVNMASITLGSGGLTAGSGSFMVGDTATGPNPFLGQIAKPALYNTALSADRVKAHVVAGGGIVPVSYKSIGTGIANAATVVNPSNITPASAPTHAVGDLLLLVTCSRSNTATVATPAGWTIFPGTPWRSATASGGTIYVFYRIATVTNTAMPVCAWTGVATGTSGDSCSAICLCFTGVHPTSPSDATATTNDSSSANPTIPTITSVTAGSTVVGIATKISDTAQTGTIPSPYFERNDGHTTSGTGHLRYIAVRDMPPGATGTAVVTASNATAARTFSVALALKPVVPTTTAVARVSLGAGVTPDTRTLHKFKLRASKAASSGLVLLRAALYEGANNRSGDLVGGFLTTSIAEYTLAISDASAAAITSYSDLELRLWATSATGDAVAVQVAEAWLETPAGAAPPVRIPIRISIGGPTQASGRAGML